MATSRKPKVVSTVKRGPAHTNAKLPASVGKNAAVKATSKRETAVKAAAKASRKAAVKPLLKGKPAATVIAPKVEREVPHVLKRDADKPLVDRLNPKLREQLRTRKVTNTEAAIALGVHETYLSRVLKDLGEEKVKGVTMAHREARSELTKVRNQTRDMLAKKVNRGEMTIEKAAKEANCSVRTMFRRCAQFPVPASRKAA